MVEKKVYRKFRPLPPKSKLEPISNEEAKARVKSGSRAYLDWYSIGDTDKILQRHWVMVTDGNCIGFAYFSNGVWTMSNNNNFYELCPSLNVRSGQKEPMYMSDITHFAYLPKAPKKKAPKETPSEPK